VETSDEPGGDGGSVERYERLRRVALAGEPSGWQLGHALLQRQGVAAWVRAWRAAPPESPPARARPPVEPPDSAGEIVGVLASMALACLAAG